MAEAGRLPPGDHGDSVLCGELATGPGAGVAISQGDWLIGSLLPLRFSLGAACCSSPAKTMNLRATSGGAEVISGEWVAGAGSPLGSGRPWHG